MEWPCSTVRFMQERRFYSADEMARMTPDELPFRTHSFDALHPGLT